MSWRSTSNCWRTPSAVVRPEILSARDARDAGTGASLALIRRVDAHAPRAAQRPREDAASPDGAGSPEAAGAVVVPDPASYQVAQSEAVAALLGVAGDGGRALLQAAAAQLEPLLRNGTTGVVRLAAESGCSGDAAAGRPATEPITLLVESRLPPARMLVFGANDFGAALVPAARLLGYHVTLCDARPAFARQQRFAPGPGSGHGLAAPLSGRRSRRRPPRCPDRCLCAHP